MNKYKVVFAITHFGDQYINKEYSGIIPASNKNEAIKTAREIFSKEFPIYSSHFKLLWCHLMLY